MISRPADRETYLAMLACLTKGINKNELIEIDFSRAKVLTSSWADEVELIVSNNNFSAQGQSFFASYLTVI